MNKRVRFSLPVASALALSLAACGGATSQEAKPPSKEAQSVLPSKASPGIEIIGEAPKGVADRARKILSMATKARHLTPKEAVKLQALAPTDLVGVVKKHVATEIPKDEIRAEGVTFVTLGLVPAGYDLEAETYALLEEQLAGLYIPEAKTMYLSTAVPDEEIESTLAHELVHALQDQHFELGARMKFRKGAADELAAISSLAEGDATVAMFDEMVIAQRGEEALRQHDTSQVEDVDPWRFLETTAGKPGTSKLTAAPKFIALGLIAPYADGMSFVNGMRRRGGWRAVDAAWSRPPSTTEQLLHLDKYLANEQAVTVPAAKAKELGAGWKSSWDDLFGEQEMRLAFSVWMDERTAMKAAEGWAGDRVTLYEADGGKAAVAWTIAFDDEANAKEAYKALADAWDARFEPGRTITAVAPVEMTTYGVPAPKVVEPVGKDGKPLAKPKPPAPKPNGPALPELPDPNPKGTTTTTAPKAALVGCRALARNGKTVALTVSPACGSQIAWTSEVVSISP
jgi:hypothetical protein